MSLFDATIPYSSFQGKHVVLGLSGGVDSSVSAALLKEHGLKVTAVFMKNWEEDDTDSYCAAALDRQDAENVCKLLDIELKTVNFADEYWDRVFENFLFEYKSGRTPNPDILCNKEIKFKAFMDYAMQALNADYIATGHYCRRSFNTKEAHLLRGSDSNKDQSYFLHAIGRNILNKVLFPVGDMEKPKVREYAQKLGLPTAKKKDSTGICFIGEKRFREFLTKYLPAQPGPIKTVDGEYIGEHQGLMYTTIGQRKGLFIGGRQGSNGKPWYVVDKDVAHNTLIVAEGNDDKALYSTGLYALNPTYIVDTPQYPFSCTCKIRYRQPDVGCTVYQEGEGLKVIFDKPVAAVAPGQSVVFYKDEDCLGGAIIDSHIKE